MPISPPRPKGPPLNALRATEAAMRLGGFAAAAEELSVTPGAISQHIRAVEDWAGTSLFTRRAQGVALTDAGQRLRPALTAAFDGMGDAMRCLAALRPDPPVQIAALPSVAQLWLTPRLPALRAALAGRRLSVTALETPPNLRREMFDASLFLRAPAPGDTVLAHDAIAPVCTPSLAATIRTPADLADHTLLHDESWSTDWTDWAKATGTPLPDTTAGPRYSLYAMAVEEAKAGAGILIGHRFLVDAALRDGTLVLACTGGAHAGWVETATALVLDVPEAPAGHVSLLTQLVASSG